MPQTIQRSFTAGEISPSLQSRATLTKYATGLNLCSNFFVRAQGGAYSRPGFRYIDELGDSTRQGRLIPFSFNTEQTYMLVFEHLKMRVIKDGAYVLVGAGPAIFELTTTYTVTELSRLAFTQSADVMTITHPDHNPTDLSRLADDNWTLTLNDYASQVTPPDFAAPHTATVTNVTNANPAVVTTSLAHSFVTKQTIKFVIGVGMDELNNRQFTVTQLTPTTFELDGEDSTNHVPYTSGGTATRQFPIQLNGTGYGTFSKYYAYVITAVDADGNESLPSTELNLNSLSLSTTGGIRLTWNPVTDASYYRVYKDTSNNTKLYGWIGDSNTTSFDDYNLAPITSDAPPAERLPFNGAEDKPATVEYYQQRQVFANTNNEPQAAFTTQTGNFKSFRTSTPARDDDAVTFTITARQVNEIRHLISLDSLIMLTSGGEWIVTEGQDEVLTPSTVGAKIQSYNGSSWTRPVIINSTALYVQEKGARVRDLAYEFSSDKYTGKDLSVMSEHLFEGKQITEMAYADEPYGILWCVRDDGVLLGLTYLREHEVVGWHQHTTLTSAGNSVFESVATISEDGRDAVYVIVRRVIDGVTKRYIERMEKRVDDVIDNCFFVDSGLSYSGAPATVFSGLDHLEGEAVTILADGYVVPGKTVTSGAVTLDIAASTVHIGLGYLPAIELLDIDTPSEQETLKGVSVSVSQVKIEVEKSLGGYVGPRQDEGSGRITTFQQIKSRLQLDAHAVPDLKTFKMEVVIDPEWTDGGGVRIEQRAPLPMSILSVIPKVVIGGS